MLGVSLPLEAMDRGEPRGITGRGGECTVHNVDQIWMSRSEGECGVLDLCPARLARSVCIHMALTLLWRTRKAITMTKTMTMLMLMLMLYFHLTDSCPKDRRQLGRPTSDLCNTIFAHSSRIMVLRRACIVVLRQDHDCEVYAYTTHTRLRTQSCGPPLPPLLL